MKIVKFIVFSIFLLLLLSVESYGYSPIQDTILNRIDRANALRKHDAEAALKMMQKALTLAVAKKERYGELKANLAIGLFYFENNDFDTAIEVYQKGITIAEELDSLELKGLALMRISNLYFNIDRFEVAKPKIEEALSIFQQEKATLNEARALANLGNIYMMLEQQDIAFNNYNAAYKLADEFGANELKLQLGSSISYYYLVNGYGKAALPYINRSLVYHLRTENKTQIAVGYGNLGYAYSLVGDYKKAFQNYQHCVDTAQKYELTRIESNTYKDIAETYKKSGDYKKSMEALTTHYALKDSLIDRAMQDKVSELQVQFETAEQQQEIETLQQQKKVRNLQISLLIIGLISFAMIGWFVFQYQRDNLLEKQEIIAKNKEIHRLEKELIIRELQQNELEQEKITAESNILKEQEATAREYAKILESSNKELESFAHIVAHDLREPLRMVTFYMQLIKRTLDKESIAKTAEYFDFALDGSERMNTLIKGILDLATVQQQAFKPKPIELNDKALVAIQNLQEMIEAKKAIVEYSDLPQIKGDKLQIIQLFQNLISNGIKYNTSEIPRVSISHRMLDNQVEISFKDNGIGIAAKNQERIFKMFNRLEGNRFAGSGIGLAICQKIVERHKGTIKVESKPNEGTTFIIAFPN